jgi:formate dehydrogenase assembly factor FdhD
VDNDGLDSYTQSFVTRHSYHIAMLDNRADLFCMIEDVGRHVTADNSLCGAADNSQGQNLKYQRGASRSLISPTCE